MREDDARKSISITCIRYLILFVARSTQATELPSTEFWEPVHFEKYVEHLNERTLIDFALSHFQQHKDDRTLHPQKHNACSQCISDRQLVSHLSYQLTNNPASLLLGSWVYSYLLRGVAAEDQWPSAKGFRNNILHTATRMKHSQVVEALLTAGADKEAWMLGKTPLLVSAEIGDVATAGVLLRKGARIDARDDKQQTALLIAAMKGHDRMISLLVNCGANKEEINRHGRAALHYAALNGHKSTVQLLLDLKADIEAKNDNSLTALHLAAWSGHEAVVRLLLDRNANIEAEDKNGWRALYFATLSNHDAMVRLLVCRNADIEARNNKGSTVLHLAALSNYEAAVRLLLDRKADIEAKNNYSSTALHLAAWSGHEVTVRLLVDRNADIEAKDNSGRTALHLASLNGHEATAWLLLDCKADIKAMDYNGSTALHFAALSGNEAIVQLLLNRKAGLKVKNSSGLTTLHLAAWRGHMATVRLLLDRNAAIKAKDNNGSTALHLAAMRGHEATVHLLIDRTASIEAKNNNGSTAHHLAAFYGHKATVRLLLDRKILEAQKNNGSTVLNVHNNMESVAEIFELPVPDESIKLPFHAVPLISVAQELVVKLFSNHLDSIQRAKFTQLRDMLAGSAPDYPVKLVCGPENTAAYHIGVEHGKYKLLDTANEPIGNFPCSADPAVFVLNLMYLVRYQIFQNIKNSTVAANLDGKFTLELDVPCEDLKANLDIILLYPYYSLMRHYSN